MEQSSLKLIAPRFWGLKKGVDFVFERSLPGQGQIVTKVGQELQAHEVVGEAALSVGYRNLPLARILGVKPAATEKYLVKPIGSVVFEGDVLARRETWRGLRFVEVLSPISGSIENYDRSTDQLVLAYLPQKVKLVAGVKGRVTEIVPEKRVMLRAKMDLVQAHLGIGKAREGTLTRVANPDVPIPPQRITTDLKNKIIWGGSRLSMQVLNQALAAGVRGVVCGGVAAADYAKMVTMRGQKEDIGLTLLFTEGFGNLPFQPEVFEYLKAREGEYVFIEGENLRLMLSAAESAESKSDVTEPTSSVTGSGFDWVVLKEGQRVRILAGDFRNRFGIVLGLDHQKKKVKVKVDDSMVEVHGYNVEVNG